MFRIGHGYDVHKLVEGRKLILGGVEIPHVTGLLGHSDADVLVHAIMDAMLGALAMGDIGHLFPDNDDLLKDIAVIGMYYVDHYTSVKKYAKANSKVRKMLKTYSDDNFVALNGCLAAIVGDTATANPILRNLETLAENGKRREKDTDFAMIEAFDIYATWLLEKETPDTEEAKKILALGLKFFPDEPVLVYDLELAKDPEYATEHAKPENAKKAEFMVKASAITDDEDDDDEDDE